MLTQEIKNRREYYRINDEIALHLRPIAEEAAHASDAFPEEAAFLAQLEVLQELELQTQTLLHYLGEGDMPLGNCLRLLDKRTALLAQILLPQFGSDFGSHRQVSLSEAGLSMVYPQSLSAGSRLALKIGLLPQTHVLLLCARVVYCQTFDGGYNLGLEFEDLSETQRQVLARHIVHRQAQQRRQEREAG